ncbi:lipopolysaccharide biosynthesis protein [Sporosarcina koreensis]|uniref:lipopolysaccharide biosynthesis protein n=1 Tax=Bacillales TaxID=1385 RepID=UPI000B12EB4D|nr:oligosaccharide flippase family protein [Sporosarcina koreensis]
MNRKFVRKVLVLVKGTLIGQIIAALAAIILARIYEPETFGYLAIHLSILTIIVTIASLKFEILVVSEKKTHIAFKILSFCIHILFINTLIVCIFVFLFIFLFKESLYPSIPVLYFSLLPISFFALGLNQILSYWAIRQEKYEVLSKTKINQNLYSSLVQIGTGLLGFKTGGLLVGDVIGRVTSNISLIRLLKDNNSKWRIKKNEVRYIAKKHYKFPIYSASANLINNISMQSPSVFLALSYNSIVVGFYSLIIRVFESPVSMIGKSVSQVLIREIAENTNEGNFEKNSFLVKKMISKITLISVPLFVTLTLLGPEIVKLIFGSTWAEAGFYLRYLAPMLTMSLYTTPFLQVLDIINEQKVFFVWQLIRLILVLAIFILVSKYIEDAKHVILIYSITMSFLSLTLILLINKLISRKAEGSR